MESKLLIIKELIWDSGIHSTLNTWLWRSLSPPHIKEAPHGAFFMCGGERGFDENPRFEKIVRNDFFMSAANPTNLSGINLNSRFMADPKGGTHGWVE